MAEKKSLKGYYLTTFLIGLGFFTMGLMDPLYDTYVPIFLGKYIESNALIGTIMSLDNVLAIFLIPIFAALSDRADTKIGRRMPFIITLLPLSAFCFGLIPFATLSSLWLLIVAVFLLNIFKQAVRGPVVALMPDMVPGDLRSEANGVINTMGGIATILGTVAFAPLMGIKINIPGVGPTDNILAFPLAAVLVLLAVIFLFIFVKEKKSQVVQDAQEATKDKEKEPILKSLKFILGEKDKSALFILLSLLFWFIGYQGVLPFLGKYSMEALGAPSGLAALGAGAVGISYAIFAIPSGKIAHKFGRKKTIRTSLLCLVVVMAVIFAHSMLTASWAPMVRLITFWLLLFLFGMFWVSIVTNSFPMLWQMADYKTMGIYTGLYYFFSQLASIISPTPAGWCIDMFGYSSLFIYALVAMGIAYFLMSKVNKGEPEDLEIEAVK